MGFSGLFWDKLPNSFGISSSRGVCSSTEAEYVRSIPTMPLSQHIAESSGTLYYAPQSDGTEVNHVSVKPGHSRAYAHLTRTV